MKIVKFYFQDKIDFKYFKHSYEKAFQREFNLNYWKWRYLENPNDEKTYIGYIQEDSNVVSFLGSSPYKIISNEKIENIAYLNIVFTNPEYQGKRYFDIVVNETLNMLKTNGFIGTYGFANHNSHYGFRKKMNWKDLAVLNNFQLDKFHITLKKNQSNKYDFKINLISEKDIENALLMNFKTANTHIDRGFEFLKWRFIDIPTHQYYSLKIFENNKLVGIVIYKIFGPEVDIMEFFYSKNQEENRYFIFTFASLQLLEKFDKINIWSNLYTDEHLFLEKLGYKETMFSAYFGIIPFCDNSQFLDYKNWHIRFMDSDVY